MQHSKYEDSRPGPAIDTSELPGWYYPTAGVIAAASVVACAMLPSVVVGPSLIAAALAVGVLSFFAAGTRSRRRISITSIRIVYLAVVAVVVLGSLVLVWTVVRPSGAVWMAWVLAGVAFAVLSFGARVMRPGRSA